VARPSTITEAQILDAAREVFLEKGIRATTAEVARRARIAEGSIFKRFSTKHELFSAAMHIDPRAPAVFPSLDGPEANDARRVLTDVALELLAFLRKLMPLVMMSMSNPAPSGLPRAFATKEPLPLQVMKRLTRVFAEQMRAGRIRRQDPEVAARLFLGAIQNYVFFELLVKAQKKRPVSEQQFAKRMVGALWRGLEPASRRREA
jgi:AcrR family transcriptional regulator